MEDEKIISLFFQRSEQAIRELADKYGGACHRLSYRIVNDRQDAEECVSDAYLGVWNTVPPGIAQSAAQLSFENSPEYFRQAVLAQGGGQARQRLCRCNGGSGALPGQPGNGGKPGGGQRACADDSVFFGYDDRTKPRDFYAALLVFGQL